MKQSKPSVALQCAAQQWHFQHPQPISNGLHRASTGEYRMDTLSQVSSSCLQFIVETQYDAMREQPLS